MSIFGVDFGNLNSTVAITRQGGVDIVTNEVSRRETTTIVSFVDNERYIGEQGLDRYVRNAQNTVFLLKRFIGLHMDDPHLNMERRFLTCAIKGDDKGRLMFGVNYCGKMSYFYPEQVLAMLLQRLRMYVNIAASSDAKATADARECVLTVPCYYSAEQRYLMMQACEIAGIHCLSLINDTTAAGLDYGIFRASSLSEKEEEGQIVGIVDIGYGSTVFSVAKFWRGNLKILSRNFDRHLGTRDVDYEIYKHMIEEVKKKYSVNVTENKRASLRLLQACERLKYLLSGNQVAPLNVENIMDVDVNIPSFHRSTLEELSSELLERFKALLKHGFAESGVAPEKFHSIEMIGGGCRIPMFKRATEELLGRPPNFTLNASETAARGAAITAAIFSPKFKVREFTVSELHTYPIKIGYYIDNPKTVSSVPFIPEVNKIVTLVTTKDYYPKVLELSIKRKPGFNIYVFYDNESPIVRENIPSECFLIGEWEIGSLKKDTNVKEVRVRVRVNPSGIISLDAAYAVEYYEVEESEDTVKDNEKAKPPTEDEEAQEKNAEAQSKPMKKTKKHLMELSLTPRLDVMGFSGSAIVSFCKHEREMHDRDSLLTRTRDSKNELESFILDNRSRIVEGGTLAPYVTAENQTRFCTLGEEYENWLYGDGADASLEEYQSRVMNLRAIGDPAQARRLNDEEVHFLIPSFKEAVMKMRESALKAIGSAAHITEEELRAEAAKCDEAIAWIEAELKKFDAAPKNTDPQLTPKVIQERQHSITVSLNALLSRPAPKPPKQPKPMKSENEEEGEAKKEENASMEHTAVATTGNENEEAAAAGNADKNTVDLD